MMLRQTPLAGRWNDKRVSSIHSNQQPRRIAVRAAAAPAAAQAPASDGVTTSTFALPTDGAKLEVLRLPPKTTGGAAARPPMLFVHGSYHAAWCWREHFMPYFAAAGYDCYALSLRCQGGSDLAPAGGAGSKVAGTLGSHADDIAAFAATLPAAPIVVAHSFAGLVVQKYLQQPSAPRLAGVAYLASVPPSGNKDMIGRFLRRAPLMSLRLTWAFVAKSFVTSAAVCREAFFSPELPEADLLRYQAQLATSSAMRLIDLQDVTRQVPIAPPPPGPARPPALVLGGALDTVVDVEGLEELAAAYGTTAKVVDGLAHDVMLDARWKEAADAVRVFADAV